LLHDVRQFVREQSLAGGRRRRIFAGAEDDVATCCVGPRLDCARCARRLAIGGDADAAEVVAEARFEMGAHVDRQRRSVTLSRAQCGARIERRISAPSAYSCRSRLTATEPSHAHDLVRDIIGFALASSQESVGS
jgi:hypothetical protein